MFDLRTQLTKIRLRMISYKIESLNGWQFEINYGFGWHELTSQFPNAHRRNDGKDCESRDNIIFLKSSNHNMIILKDII